MNIAAMEWIEFRLDAMKCSLIAERHDEGKLFWNINVAIAFVIRTQFAHRPELQRPCDLINNEHQTVTMTYIKIKIKLLKLIHITFE